MKTKKLTGCTHNALFDFGKRDCDDIATILINGGTSVSFTLR